MSLYGITGLSVALVNDKEVIWSEGFGKSSSDTIYSVGSISKLFTATAIMQLKEQKLINLDVPITEYIPEFSIKTRYKNSKITIRTLMTHQSGLPKNKMSNMWGESEEDFNSLVKYLNSLYTNYPENKMVSYSNIGVSLLGVVIERVTGQSFIDYMDTNILKPLEMNTASFRYIASRTDIDKELISKAYPHRSGQAIDAYKVRDVPAGSLNGSVLDMSQFIMMILNNGTLNGNRILKEESIKEMLTIQNSKNSLDLGIKVGLNFLISSNKKLTYIGKAVGHSGATIYHYSNMIIIPEHNLGLILSTNSLSGRYIIEDLPVKLIQYAYKIDTGIMPPEVDEIDFGEPVILSESEKSNLVGTYATLHSSFSIYTKGEKLKIKFGSRKLTLIPHENNWFSFQSELFGIFKRRARGLEDIRIKLIQDNNTILAIMKTPESSAFAGEKALQVNIPAEWENRIGTYKVTNPSDIEILKLKERELYIENGYLYFGSYILNPFTKDDAYIFGSRDNISVREVDGNEILEISGYKFKKVK